MEKEGGEEGEKGEKGGGLRETLQRLLGQGGARAEVPRRLKKHVRDNYPSIRLMQVQKDFQGKSVAHRPLPEQIHHAGARIIRCGNGYRQRSNPSNNCSEELEKLEGRFSRRCHMCHFGDLGNHQLPSSPGQQRFETL